MVGLLVIVKECHKNTNIARRHTSNCLPKALVLHDISCGCNIYQKAIDDYLKMEATPE